MNIVSLTGRTRNSSHTIKADGWDDTMRVIDHAFCGITQKLNCF